MPRLTAERLSKMKDEDYKLLTQEQLMEPNKQMPETDYENPATHQSYPKALYRLVQLESGEHRMQTTVVKSAKQHEALGPGWKESPADFGVETHPGRPDVEVDDSFAVAMAEPPPEPVPVIAFEQPVPQTAPIQMEDVAPKQTAAKAPPPKRSHHKKKKPKPAAKPQAPGDILAAKLAT